MNNTIKLSEYIDTLGAIDVLDKVLNRFDEEDLRGLLRNDYTTLEGARDAMDRIVSAFQSVRGYK